MKKRQVLFIDEHGECCAGLLTNKGIICACCESLFDPEEVTILKTYEDCYKYLNNIAKGKE